MLGSLSRMEFFTTLLGGLIAGLIGIAAPLSFGATQRLLIQAGLAALTQPMTILVVMIMFSALLFGGILKGLRRHADISPLLFTVLGVTSILMGQHLLHTALFTVLGGFCVWIGTIWDIALRSPPPPGESAPPPSLEAFLDTSKPEYFPPPSSK